MSMTGTIVRLGDRVHVRYACRLTTEPVEHVRYWPLVNADMAPDGARADYRGDGFWSVDCRPWGTRSFGGPNGGATEATKVESTPVPPPRTKLETRWYDGRWQKLLKRGWVDA